MMIEIIPGSDWFVELANGPIPVLFFVCSPTGDIKAMCPDPIGTKCYDALKAPDFKRLSNERFE